LSPTYISNVHAGALPDGLEAFQNLDLIRVVIASDLGDLLELIVLLCVVLRGHFRVKGESVLKTFDRGTLASPVRLNLSLEYTLYTYAS
jgi:hypothetical protein